MSTKLKEKDMSANEPKVVQIKKTFEGYDENLEPKSVDIDFNFTEPVTYEEAVQRLNGDTSKMLQGLIGVLRREAIANERAKAGAANFINREALMLFIKPYRDIEPYSNLVTATDKRKASAEEWNAQTTAIIADAKKSPFTMSGIKKLSDKMNQED